MLRLIAHFYCALGHCSPYSIYRNLSKSMLHLCRSSDSFRVDALTTAATLLFFGNKKKGYSFRTTFSSSFFISFILSLLHAVRPTLSFVLHLLFLCGFSFWELVSEEASVVPHVWKRSSAILAFTSPICQLYSCFLSCH